MKSFKNKNYEQALIETFLKFDDILRTEKVNGLLKKYHNTQLNQNFEMDMKINFNNLQDENLLCELNHESASLDIFDDTMILNNLSRKHIFQFFLTFIFFNKKNYLL